jgi:hypothetical protein
MFSEQSGKYGECYLKKLVVNLMAFPYESPKYAHWARG